MKKYLKKGFTSAALFLGAYHAQAAEFFIKLNRTGQHTVLFSDQYQTNTSNIYRFFDIPAGNVSLKISDANTGILLYDGLIALKTDERTVAEMGLTGTIDIVATYKVTYSNWYTQNQTVNVAPVGPITVDDAKFNEIKNTIDKEFSDNGKVTKAKSITKKHFFTAKQIAEVCKLMTFDNYKLEYAKYAYDFCVDKGSYFVVSEVFQFSSYSRELDEYVDKKN